MNWTRILNNNPNTDFFLHEIKKKLNETVKGQKESVSPSHCRGGTVTYKIFSRRQINNRVTKFKCSNKCNEIWWKQMEQQSSKRTRGIGVCRVSLFILMLSPVFIASIKLLFLKTSQSLSFARWHPKWKATVSHSFFFAFSRFKFRMCFTFPMSGIGGNADRPPGTNEKRIKKKKKAERTRNGSVLEIAGARWTFPCGMM